MTTVLVVDDDPQILRALRITLTAHGYHVRVAADGAEGLRAAAEHPDVIVLDLGLPDLDGTEVIKAVRGWRAVPIVVLSARTDSVDKVQALDVGADDYVTKPFGMDELLARIRAALRRAAPPGEEASVIETADFVIDLAAKRVTRQGREVRLTPTEWNLVEVLVRHQGRLVGQRQLLREVWGPTYGEETHYLRVFVGQIRRKLEPEASVPRYFITEPGMGYRFEAQSDIKNT